MNIEILKDRQLVLILKDVWGEIKGHLGKFMKVHT